MLVSAAILPADIGQLNNQQIERQVELTIALRHEIVVNRAEERTFGVVFGI